MITVDYCCLDASAFSVGFASAHEKTLIIEKSENVLSDYVNAVLPSEIISEPVTDAGKYFTDFLKKFECVSDTGIVDTPSLAPAAAKYCEDMYVLINAKVINVMKITEDKYNVLIYTNSGLLNISCRKVIVNKTETNTVKYLNCIVSDTDYGTLSAMESEGVIISRSYEKNEFIISFPVSSDSTLNEARINCVKLMKSFFGTSIQIDAFATDFMYSTDNDIIKDFEAGVLYDI